MNGNMHKPENGPARGEVRAPIMLLAYGNVRVLGG